MENLVLHLHLAHLKSSEPHGASGYCIIPHRFRTWILKLLDFDLCFVLKLYEKMDPWPPIECCSTNKILICFILFHRIQLKKVREKAENPTSVGRETGVWLGLDEEWGKWAWVGSIPLWLSFRVHMRNAVVSLPRWVLQRLNWQCTGQRLLAWASILVVSLELWALAGSQTHVCSCWFWALFGGRGGGGGNERDWWNPKYEATVRISPRFGDLCPSSACVTSSAPQLEASAFSWHSGTICLPYVMRCWSHGSYRCKKNNNNT